MDILVVKLVCLAILTVIFLATVWLTPFLYGVRGKAREVGDAAARKRAVTRSSG